MDGVGLDRDSTTATEILIGDVIFGMEEEGIMVIDHRGRRRGKGIVGRRFMDWEGVTEIGRMIEGLDLLVIGDLIATSEKGKGSATYVSVKGSETGRERGKGNVIGNSENAIGKGK